MLDLNSREWVEERMVQRVEVEIEGERWVGDLAVDDDDESSSRNKQKKDWEENSVERKMGEWRRRRWIRMVRRKVVSDGSTAAT